MTAFHKKISDRLREIRSESGIWLAPADITHAYKPLKMGLRMTTLHEPWDDFVESYDRINSTCSKLFRVELSESERKKDLDRFK